MTDPLAFLALALAGGGGTIDGAPVRYLVAGGVALLQRGAPLVRALQRRRSALFLPPGGGWVVALAASEGRSALLIDPGLQEPELPSLLAEHDVGAVFTLAALASRLPGGVPCVLLDAAPARVVLQLPGGAPRTIDLVSHEGLRLEGDLEAEGSRDEACRYTTALGETAGATHQEILAGARAFVNSAHLASRDHALVLGTRVTPGLLVYGLVAPLLAGGRVSTRDGYDASAALATLEQDGVSLLVGDTSHYEALLAALDTRGGALDAPVLQRCIAAGGADPALAERWRAATGLGLLQQKAHARPAGT